MRDFRAMMECGTTAQLIKLLENNHKSGLEMMSYKEIEAKYEEERIELLDEMSQPEDSRDYTEIIREAADVCNMLYALIWYSEKLLKIKDSKKRRRNAKRIIDEMVGNSGDDRNPGKGTRDDGEYYI